MKVPSSLKEETGSKRRESVRIVNSPKRYQPNCRYADITIVNHNYLIEMAIILSFVGWIVGGLAITWLSLPKDDGTGDYDDAVQNEVVLGNYSSILLFTFPLFLLSIY